MPWRLGMSVEQTISHYGTLAGDVFSDKQAGGDRKFRRVSGRGHQDIVKAHT